MSKWAACGQNMVSLRTEVPGGIRRSGSLAPNFASEIRVRLPNFASQNIGDKYPKFCPLNFRCDPKICVVDLSEFSQAVYSLVTFKVTSKQII